MTKQWYVIQVQTGQENSVKLALERQLQLNPALEIADILIPMEDVVEMKDGKKRHSKRKFYPGYVLLEAEMTDQVWHVVKSTTKVLGFLGASKGKPVPISSSELAAIQARIQEGSEKPKPKVLFEAGEVVRVIEGPFKDFNGTVEEVNYERSRLRLQVSIFGRATSFELSFSQVEKDS